MMSIIKITKTGIKRRRSEIRYVSFVTLVAVLFMSAITLFQEIANAYVMESNYHNYGDWVISSVYERLSHPYFSEEGYTVTGPMILSEEEENTFLYVGCVDENLADFGRINLYEGRLPENEQEIAMDIFSLAKLGYSYELGQTIIIRFYDGEGTVQKLEYELVGSLINFAENWRHMDKYSLPNALVTAEGLEGYGCETFTTYFYQFDKSYDKIDVREFAENFVKPLGDQIYNSFVYENQIWGNTEIYDIATYVLIFISVLAMGYLLTIYIGKRRGCYYQLRSMGASKLQIRQMICVEALYATLPQVGFGLVVPYVTSYVLCILWAQRNGMQSFWALDIQLLGKQLAMIGVMLVLTIGVAQLSISDKRLVANTGNIKPFWYAVLRKAAKKTQKPEKVLLQRYEKTRPLQGIMSLLLTVLVCAGIVVCFNHMAYAFTVYGESSDSIPDFELTMETDYYYEKTNGYVAGTMRYLFHGIDEALQEQIGQIPGIEETEYIFADEALYLDWEDKEDSPMIQNMQAASEERVEYENHAYTNIYSTYQGIGALPEEKADSAMDWEKWQAGEQIIVLLQTSYYDWKGARESGESPFAREKLTIYDNTIQPGDMVTMKNLETDLSYSVMVGAVYYVTDYSDTTLSYRIVMSRALGEKLAEAEGLEMYPTKMELKFNHLASFEASEKVLAKLAEENGMYYTSHMEGKRIAYQDMVQKVGVYGIIMIMLIVVYIVLQKSFWNSTIRYRKENYRILKQIGMTDVQYMKLAKKQAVKKYLWLYAGMVAGYGIVFYIQFQQIRKELVFSGYRMMLGSELLNEFTDNVWILGLEYVLLDMKHVGVLLLVTLLFITMVWSIMKTVKKYVEESR